MDVLDIPAGDPNAVNAAPYEHKLALAKQHAERGDLDQAVRIWARLRQDFPDRRQTYIDAAAQLRLQGRMEEAETWLEAGLQYFADDLGFAIERSWLAFHRRDLPEAIRRWEAVAAKFPDHPAGCVGLAVSLQDAGRADEADVLLARAKQKFPADLGIFVEHAWLAHRRRDWPEAIARWEAVRLGFPDRAVGYTAAAATLREAGQTPAAEALLSDAVVRFPDDLTMAVEFAQFASHKQDWAAAGSRWQRVRERFPQAPQR